MEDNNRSEELSSSTSSQLAGLGKGAAKGVAKGTVKGAKKAINFAKKKMGKALKAKVKLLLSQSLLVLLPYLIGGIILGTVVIAFQSGIFSKDIDKIELNFDENGDRELREEVQLKIAEINSQIPEGSIGLPSETRINQEQVLMFANQAYLMISEDARIKAAQEAKANHHNEEIKSEEKTLYATVAGEKINLSDEKYALRSLALIGLRLFKPKVITEEVEVNIKATYTELVTGAQPATAEEVKAYEEGGGKVLLPQSEEEILTYNAGTIYELKASMLGTGGFYKIIHIQNPTEKNYKEKMHVVREVHNIMNVYNYTYEVIQEVVQGNPADFKAIGEVTLERELPVITGRTEQNEKNYQTLKEIIKGCYPFSEEDAEMLTEIVANATDPNSTYLFESVDYTSGFAYNLADLSQFGIPQEYITYFYEAEKIYKLPAWYLAAIARQESDFNPQAEYKGAHGIMQFQRYDINGKDLFQYHLDNGLTEVLAGIGIKVVSADQAWDIFLNSTRVQVIATSWVVNKYFNMAYRDFKLPKSQWGEFPTTQWQTLYAPKFSFELSEENKPLFMKALAYYNAGEGTVGKWNPQEKYMSWPYSVSVWEYMNQYSGQIFERSLINWSFNTSSILRPFGNYKDASTGESMNSIGTLITSKQDTPVPVLTGGEVTTVKESTLIIKSKDATDNYIYVEYLNLKDIYVTAGDRVAANQIIATNKHNYLEIRIKSEGTYVDPLDFIKKENAKIEELNLSGSEKFRALMAVASPYEGVKYVYGGNSMSGIDCSGLTVIAYKAIGYSLPRTAQGQYDKVTNKGATLIRDFSQAKPGDLVFYTKTYEIGRYITHVAIYLGNGRIFEAAGNKVRYSTVSPTNPKFVGFGRVFN